MLIATYIKDAVLRLDFEPIEEDQWRDYEVWAESGAKLDTEGEFAWIVVVELDRAFAAEISDSVQFWIDQDVGSAFDTHSYTDSLGRCSLLFRLDCSDLGWSSVRDVSLASAVKNCREVCAIFEKGVARFYTGEEYLRFNPDRFRTMCERYCDIDLSSLPRRKHA